MIKLNAGIDCSVAEKVILIQKKISYNSQR